MTNFRLPIFDSVSCLARLPSWPRCAFILKLIYAVIAGALSVCILSFAPAEGPPINRFVPAQAGIVLQIHDGDSLLRILFRENPNARELLSDPDVKDLFGEYLSKSDEALENLRQLPVILRRLIPATREGLFPFAGNECAVAMSIPPESPRTRQFVVFTRVSGAQGQLARIAARFATLPKNMKVFDLGGDLLALGFNGGAPALNAAAGIKSDTALTAQAGQSASFPGALALGRLTVYPGHFPSRQKSVRKIPVKEPGVPVDGFLNDTVDENFIAEYLTKPASAAEMLNLKQIPDEIELEFFSRPDAITAAASGWVRGHISGGVFKEPLRMFDENASSDTAGSGEKPAFAEGTLPFNAKPCFINYLQDAMQSRRSKQRWLGCFDDLEDQGISLDRDLWPAMGGVMHFTFQDAPENLTLGEYGVLKGSFEFDGMRPRARLAAGELVRGRWEVLDGRGDAPIKSQYVRRMHTENSDRYVLVTKQIMAPMWTVSGHEFSLVSDAGPFALLDKSPENPGPPAAPKKLDGSLAASYFLRLNGPRMASKVEAWATLYFDTLEEDMGTPDFLDVYPDAAARIRVARKLSRFLGQVEVHVTPSANGTSADIQGSWIPGSLAEPAAPKAEDVAPPQ